MKLTKILLFNPITELFLKPSISKTEEEPNRIVHVFSELTYHLSIFLPVGAALFLFSFGVNSTLSNLLYDILFTSIIVILLNKDFFNGQSVVKRKTGFQVVDFKSKKTASELQCIIRNITLLVWPIETPFFLVNSKRRLGDYIAGTMLIKTAQPTNPETILNDIQNKKYTLKILLIILFSTIIAISVTEVINLI